MTVTNGTVTLPRKVAKAAVGLPYRWELETVELDLPDPTQTVQVRKRQLTRAWIRFYQCRECRYGPDARSRLSEFPFRTGNPGVPIQPFTGDKEVAFSASASGQPSSSLYLCGDDPVPAGVLAVMAEVSIGD